MPQTIQELERDIEETRARLDLTIDRIQDKMSVSGIVDDLMGSVRRTQYATVMDRALEAVRRNPVPVLLVAVGIGWLAHRINEDARRRAVRSYRHPYGDAHPDIRGVGVPPGDRPEVPVASATTDRVYEPGAVAAHPSEEPVAARQTMYARS